jgi:hypothetical protein
MGALAEGRRQANLMTVADDLKDTENRKDRARQRSEEAHWRVAEEGAGEQKDRPKQENEERQEEARPADR